MLYRNEMPPVVDAHRGYVLPSAITAIGCAVGSIEAVTKKADELGISYDGYISQTIANDLIRSLIKVKKRIRFKKSERVTFAELVQNHPTMEAIVHVSGNYLYLIDERYYSFYGNDDDLVKTIWIITEVDKMRENCKFERQTPLYKSSDGGLYAVGKQKNKWTVIRKNANGEWHQVYIDEFGTKKEVDDYIKQKARKNLWIKVSK